MKTTGFKLYQFHNFQLLDADDKPVGLIDWIWADEASGQGGVIGLRLRWLRGTACAVRFLRRLESHALESAAVPYRFQCNRV